MALGRRWVVDMDLEKFFDRVNHDVLMARLRRKVRDKRVLGLIGRYLRAGLMAGGTVTQRTQGDAPGWAAVAVAVEYPARRSGQGTGTPWPRLLPLCRRLATSIMRTRRAGERVLASVSRFLDRRLKLKVNDAKSAVERPWKRTFLGYSMTHHHKARLKVAAPSVARLKDKLREVFRRGRGRSLAKVIEEITPILRGWTAYFRLAEVKGGFEDLDGWVRRKLRVILWRQWKRPRTRARKLMQTRTRQGAGMDVRHERTGLLVERRGFPHEPSLPERPTSETSD